jgi:hypothetical protein
MNDCCCRQRSEEPAGAAGHNLSHIAYREADRGAKGGCDHHPDSEAEHVRSENSDKSDADPESKPKAQADRVPRSHATEV